MARLDIKEVREFLMDTPDLNMKLEDEMFTDKMLNTATNWAYKQFEVIPPYNSEGPENAPHYLILLGTVAQLFFMKSMNLAINFAPNIQENGVNIPTGEEQALYDAIFEKLNQRFEQKVSEWKDQQNVKQSLTSIISPFNRTARRGTSGGYY